MGDSHALLEGFVSLAAIFVFETKTAIILRNGDRNYGVLKSGGNNVVFIESDEFVLTKSHIHP